MSEVRLVEVEDVGVVNGGAIGFEVSGLDDSGTGELLVVLAAEELAERGPSVELKGAVDVGVSSEELGRERERER